MSSVLLATGFLVAALVGAAAVLKILRWSEFRRELADYRLLPGSLEWPTAVAIPLVEAGSVVAFWIPDLRPYGALALALLLGVFAAVVAISLRRGRRDVRCACFGRSSRAITWILPVRNIALACVPMAVLVAGAMDASLSAASAWTAAGLAGTLGWLLLEYAGVAATAREG